MQRHYVNYINFTPCRALVFTIPFFFSFTLYIAQNRISRGNLGTQCLDSVPFKTLQLPTLRGILDGLRVEWRNSLPRFASLPDRVNENIKYFFFSSGNRTHNRLYLLIVLILNIAYSQYCCRYFLQKVYWKFYL